jgi:hypothetical protein
VSIMPLIDRLTLSRAVPVPARESGSVRREPRSESVRVLLAAALGPVVAGYAVMAAAVAVTVSLAPRGSVSAEVVFAAAGSGWLAAWHIPLSVRGGELGILPLGAGIVMVWLVATSAARAATRLRVERPKDAPPIVLATAAEHATAGVLTALACRSPLVRVSPAVALLGCGIFAALSAGGGLAFRAGLVCAARSAVRPLYRRGMLGGGLGLAALVGLGALLYIGSLLASAGQAAAMLSDLASGAGGALGVVLLCLGYLPNAVIGAMSFVVGPGLHVGSVALTPFSYTTGDLPSVPLLAATPEQWAPWWPVLLALPLAVGALLGWYLREADPVPTQRLRGVAVAALLAAVGAGVLGLLVGGQLGGGEFSSAGVPAFALAGAVLGWLALPGAAVAYFAGPHEPAGKDSHVMSEEPAAEDDEPEDDEPEDDDETTAEAEPEEAPSEAEDSAAASDDESDDEQADDLPAE